MPSHNCYIGYFASTVIDEYLALFKHTCLRIQVNPRYIYTMHKDLINGLLSLQCVN